MDAEKKKRGRVRVLEPRPSLRSGSRHLTWFLVADLAFALPLSQRRYGMAMNHRVVFSLRVEGPPARKSRLSAVRVSSEFVTLQRERGDRSACFFFFFLRGLVGALKLVGRPSEARRLAGGRPPQRACAAPTRAASSLFEFPAGTRSAGFSGGGRKPRCPATS